MTRLESSTMSTQLRLRIYIFSALVHGATGSFLFAGDISFQLQAPLNYQVFQRAKAKPEFGKIAVIGELSKAREGGESTLIEGRVVGPGLPGDWQLVERIDAGKTGFRGDISAPSGGWFVVEMKASTRHGVYATTTVDHVGVGEVFIIAGQSNSANHGGEKLKTHTGLVSSFDGEKWQLANDPQPGASGRGGSFIPAFGDAMAERFDVPIGIAATGVGATSVREWLPVGTRFPNPPTLTRQVNELPDGGWEAKGEIFSQLIKRMRRLHPGGGARAVLWHQGESDANQKDPTRTLKGDLYRDYLALLIEKTDKNSCLGEVARFVAQASYHNPGDTGSPDIRAAQKALWESGIALEGPDTDTLTGKMRDKGGMGVHLSGDGLRAHGALWVEEVAPWLEAQLSKPVKVFLLAGQSNMQGQGVVSMDDPKNYNGGKGNLVWSMKHSASKDQMRHLVDANGNWVERDDVTITYKPRDKVRTGRLAIGYTGYGGSSHIGPELQFGHVIGDHLDDPVLLIKTAWGGKSLHKDFRPPSAGGETGPYYKQMIAEIRDALATLGDTPYELCGFVWMQGWNDMISKEATAEYAHNLVHLAHDIRAEFKSPGLPIVVGELGNGGPAREGSGMEEFRAAQKSGTARIPNAVFVETHSFARPKDFSPNRGHGHHWFGNAESYFLIGDALGKAMVQITGKDAL